MKFHNKANVTRNIHTIKKLEEQLKEIMRLLCLTLLLFTINNTAKAGYDNYYQEQQTITGQVTDEKGQPLEGVSIVIKGTGNEGTTTGKDGRFTLQAGSNASVLIFSYTGMATQEIALNGRSTLVVSLKQADLVMEDVVVIGYGTVRKSDLTGSVARVKSQDLTAYPASGLAQALQGRAAGVTVQSNNGDPGGGFRVRVRGGTSINAGSDPVYVVDGFIGGILPPPEDIESLEVLKDASATAIYGSRGANGVILVTTKRGKAGKPRIELNASYTSNKEINRLEMLNTDEFIEFVKVRNPNYVSGGANTNWQDLIFQPGNIQNYQLSFSGGSQGVKYFISGVYFDQKGIIKESSFKRYSITSNLSFDVSNAIQIGANLFAQRSNRDGVRTQEGTGGASNAGVVGAAYRFQPDLPINNPNGSFTIARFGDPIDNPFAIVTQREQNTITDQFQANVFADVKLFEGFSFRTNLGANSINSRNGEYIPTTINEGANIGGQATVINGTSTNLISENFFTYKKGWGEDHSLTAIAGYSFQKTVGESYTASAQNFVSDVVSFNNLAGGSVAMPPASTYSQIQLSSYYARANYSYKGKYLITLNARYDGSSNFSANNKWAFFPSGALAWNMGSEKFMNKFKSISSWKWRVSYGLTGNQAIAAYQTLATFSNVFTIINGVPVNAVRPTSVANDNLKWETTAQLNIGADIGFFKERLTLTADYYRMVTSDLLFNLPLPTYSGYTSLLTNIGKVENKGIELTLGGKILTGKLKWDASLNWSANENKILELPGGTDVFYSRAPGHMAGIGNTHVLRVGAPVGAFWGYIYDGVYQQGDVFIPGGGFEQAPGGEKYRDINGRGTDGKLTGTPDGRLNTDDQTIVGDPNPDFIWGFNNTLGYKGFDLNIFFQGSQGNDLMSFTLLENELLGGNSGNQTKRTLNRWTPSNTNTNIPAAVLSRAQRVSTRVIYDGSYARLKNIALGYTLPKKITDKMKIDRIRLYISAQNILTFTSYPGVDPEVNYLSGGGAAGNLNAGLDYASYPNASSVTFGLNIGF
ncbi:MAG: TonB-dependent receptor [Chitinophagaceae bacterium]|jgi:TonB-linked SusC/RagA family outer membrane protein|nr:TonB-dependent receptor [Chitinophagaceae bacterium]